MFNPGGRVEAEGNCNSYYFSNHYQNWLNGQTPPMRRDGSGANGYRRVVRRRSRLASDSSQLTIDSTIAAQIAVHQK